MTFWYEGRPSPSERISRWQQHIREHKSAFSEGIEKFFYWGEHSGTSAGVPRWTSESALSGNFRAFYGLESSVSTEVLEDACRGRYYVTSDTSRLWSLQGYKASGYGAVLPSYLTPHMVGSTRAVLAEPDTLNTGLFSQTSLQDGNGNFFKPIVMFGKSEVTQAASSVATYTITFSAACASTASSPYQTPPRVFAFPISPPAAPIEHLNCTVQSVTADQAVVEMHELGPAPALGVNFQFYWMSIGTGQIFA